MKIGLIVPTYGYISDDAEDSGSKGTKIRLEWANELISCGAIPSNIIVPFPQRMSRDSVVLGANVANFASSMPEFGNANIVHEPISVGTWNDVIASYKMIAKQLNCIDEEVDVYFVSDLSQLWRMRLQWMVTRPRGWNAVFYRTPKPFRSKKDLLVHEPLSYAKTFLKCLALFPTLIFRGYPHASDY
jgi:hypothetical protein